MLVLNFLKFLLMNPKSCMYMSKDPELSREEAIRMASAILR